MSAIAREIDVVLDRDRAALILHPLRLRILEVARIPASAAGLARRLGLKPQKVNYHVRRLEEAGFLRAVEERRAGNIVETVYVATAESYVLASSVLGGLSPSATDATRVTVGRWLGLQARAEVELAEVLEAAGEETRALGALAMDAEFRFETAEQRKVFGRAVRELFAAVVTRYVSPLTTPEGDPGPGRPYRMILGCYPVPESGSTSGGPEG